MNKKDKLRLIECNYFNYAQLDIFELSFIQEELQDVQNSEININTHPFPTVYFHKNYLTCISLVKPASCDGCLRRDDSYYDCFVFRNYSCSMGRSRMGKASVRLSARPLPTEGSGDQ